MVTLQKYYALQARENTEELGAPKIISLDLNQSLLFSIKMLDRLKNRQTRRESEIEALMHTEVELKEAEKKQKYEKKLKLLDYNEALARLNDI